MRYLAGRWGWVGGLALVAGRIAAQEPAATTAPPPAPEPIANSIGMKLVRIPAGEFEMGSSHEFGRDASEEKHAVKITKPFLLGIHEVTQGQFEKIMGQNPSAFSANGARKDRVQGMDTSQFPVDNVTWEEATEFCRKLSELPEEKQAGRAYRLPTEAEWEYACRAGTTTPFHYGESLSSTQANFDGDDPYLAMDEVIKGADPAKAKGPDLKRPAVVGSYAPNSFGLYDMHGNVWEWCSDWFSPTYYKNSPKEDPQGPETGTIRVYRGGSWYWFGAGCRSACRPTREGPAKRRETDGFRVACVETPAS